jgi:hypothetical protein
MDPHSFSKLDPDLNPDPHLPKKLDLDSDPHKVNAYPKHWLQKWLPVFL